MCRWYVYYMPMKVSQLKQVRIKKIMTQRELAKKSGIRQNAISRIEAGTGALPKTIRALAKALDVEPSVLVEVPLFADPK